MSLRKDFSRKFRETKKNFAKEKDGGFTLIELSLALVFLAFIMLFIITLIMQMIDIYNKSIALSQMNNAGQELMTDLNNNAFGGTIANNSNRLCINGNSYVWNYRGQTGTFGGSLVRVTDPNATLCATPSRTAPIQCINNTKITSGTCDSNTPASDVSIVVSSNIWIQQMAITSSAGSPLASVKMTVSTGGNNAPFLRSNSATKANAANSTNYDASALTCLGKNAGSNNFCAFANYQLMVYQRAVR